MHINQVLAEISKMDESNSNQDAPISMAPSAMFLANHPKYKDVPDAEVVKLAQKKLSHRILGAYRGFPLAKIINGVLVYNRAMAVAVLMGTNNVLGAI